jgi:hypothetical protein
MSGVSIFIAADPRHTVAASPPIEFDGDDIGGTVETVNAGEFHGSSRKPDCLRGLHERISMGVHAANDYGDLCGLNEHSVPRAILDSRIQSKVWTERGAGVWITRPPPYE